MLHVISKQVTCETTEVLCAGSCGSKDQRCENWALLGCMGARRNKLCHPVCDLRILRISMS